jgi:LysR family transcriptional activator of nhaA
LLDTLKDRPTGAAMRLTVGLSDAVPKGIAYRLLAPALALDEKIRLECVEDRTERLLGDLAAHIVDLVIADSPVGPGSTVRAYSHLLGECGIGVFAAPRLASEHAKGFPRSLDGAPFLLPTIHCALRRTLDAWFADADIHPVVAGEFDDGSLLARFGEMGVGLFAAPTAIGKEIRRLYGVRRVGTLARARDQFYAITVDRQVKHPGVAAITSGSRQRLTG